ncbi:unnamed protein product [Auanema sp. JU1783]|nr:unnamed protein product [Auanema sp. JU1783]
MSLSENNRLEAQKWYHGLTTRDICSPLLKEKGDYLVRASQKGSSVGITLNVRNDNEKKAVDNFAITTVGSERRYVLRAVIKENNFPAFDSIPNLVKYYKIHDLPNGIRLRRGISRPKWLISNEAVVYEKSSELGSGNFGAVYKGTLHNCIPCAIKIVQMRDKDSTPSETDVEQENEARIGMIREADLMASYHHENIVKFLGFACFHPPLMLVLELCNGGSLDKHLRKNGTECTDYEKLVYILEAARGMNYLHRKNCIHRDLASRNCLIDQKGIIKISDFGLSVSLKAGSSITGQMSIIPLRWMAPECLRSKMEFSFKTDIWAFGVLIYEVFSNGSKPFVDIVGDDVDRRIIKAIKSCQMPSAPRTSHTVVQQLFDDIWQKDPEKRPTFSILLKNVIEALRGTPSILPTKFVLNKIEGIQRESDPKLNYEDNEKRSNSLSSNQGPKTIYRKSKHRNGSYRLSSNKNQMISCSVVDDEASKDVGRSFHAKERQHRKKHFTERQTIQDDYDHDDNDDDDDENNDDDDDDERRSNSLFGLKSDKRIDVDMEKRASSIKDTCKTPPTPR